MLNINQQDGETNNEFIKRFQQLAANIKNIDVVVVIMAIKRVISHKEENSFNYMAREGPSTKSQLFFQ